MKIPRTMQLAGTNASSYGTMLRETTTQLIKDCFGRQLPPGAVLINTTYYSRTTARHQRIVDAYCPPPHGNAYAVIDNVPRGTTALTDYARRYPQAVRIIDTQCVHDGRT
jgi:hypothetical protein